VFFFNTTGREDLPMASLTTTSVRIGIAFVILVFLSTLLVTVKIPVRCAGCDVSGGVFTCMQNTGLGTPTCDAFRAAQKKLADMVGDLDQAKKELREAVQSLFEFKLDLPNILDINVQLPDLNPFDDIKLPHFPSCNIPVIDLDPCSIIAEGIGAVIDAMNFMLGKVKDVIKGILKKFSAALYGIVQEMMKQFQEVVEKLIEQIDQIIDVTDKLAGISHVVDDVKNLGLFKTLVAFVQGVLPLKSASTAAVIVLALIIMSVAGSVYGFLNMFSTVLLLGG
jgi:hypothetical protein